MSAQTIMWIGFAALLLIMFILDLGVFGRRSHEIKFREALSWTLLWVSLAFAFNAWIYHDLGRTKALEFLTGYIIEESLSVDNLFVFIMIFSYFGVSKAHQPKILKWGIIGALIMRGIFIYAGIGLLARFHWLVYIFGGFLVFTGVKMAFGREERIKPEKNLMVRLVGRFFLIAADTGDGRFFRREKERFAVTPLFLTLLVVESSDLIFATDSIPAILAVTRDPFIVYTSNIFAIMGLRSLYYLLASVIEMFVYLKTGVSLILTFVGVKMIAAEIYPIPIHVSLMVIASVLAISVILSITLGKKKRPKG
ncbi:MAG TPA: TerC family protein [Geobacteraceae bacterium]|nr:TerC family protein [Geobacteraceae bacterium]